MSMMRSRAALDPRTVKDIDESWCCGPYNSRRADPWPEGDARAWICDYHEGFDAALGTYAEPVEEGVGRVDGGRMSVETVSGGEIKVVPADRESGVPMLLVGRPPDGATPSEPSEEVVGAQATARWEVALSDGDAAVLRGLLGTVLDEGLAPAVRTERGCIITAASAGGGLVRLVGRMDDRVPPYTTEQLGGSLDMRWWEAVLTSAAVARLRESLQGPTESMVIVDDPAHPPWGDDRHCPTCGEGPLELRESTGTGPIALTFISHCGESWIRGQIRRRAV